MKISKENYDKLVEKVGALEKAINGGKGSGNFGHSGRPGYVGGSGDGVKEGTSYSWSAKDESFKGNDIDLGGEPKDIVDFSEDSGRLQEATGALGYDVGNIRVGYDNKTDAPFRADSESESEYNRLTEENRQLMEEQHRLYREASSIVESGQYVIDPSKPAEYGNLVRSYSSKEDIMRSNMPQDKKDKYAKVSKELDESYAKARANSDKKQEIAKNAEYHPNGMGAKSALLVTGLAKGISNYLGQRSDGAGENSFNDGVKRAVDSKSWAHKNFIDALRNPESYTDEQFNSYKIASSKLASSQASYLKRVENSIDEPNFMGSREFANTAKAIKNLTRAQVIYDKNQMRLYPGTYISFKNGSPEIIYK